MEQSNNMSKRALLQEARATRLISARALLEKGYEVHGVVRRASVFNTDRIDHLYIGDHLYKNRTILRGECSFTTGHQGEETAATGTLCDVIAGRIKSGLNTCRP
jgi:hypothetical protein